MREVRNGLALVVAALLVLRLAAALLAPMLPLLVGALVLTQAGTWLLRRWQ